MEVSTREGNGFAEVSKTKIRGLFNGLADWHEEEPDDGEEEEKKL